MKETMSYQEKQSVLSLVNTILIFGFYSLYVYNRFVSGSPEVLNDFSFWGKAFLILIPFAIVIHVVMQILFAIFNKIVANEEAPDKMDEMDKLIELKSIRISHWIFITGFFSAMGSMAFGMNPSMMFIQLIAAGFIAGIVSDITKIYFYRKGV
jgi:hypothetical protein